MMGTIIADMEHSAYQEGAAYWAFIYRLMGPQRFIREFGCVSPDKAFDWASRIDLMGIYINDVKVDRLGSGDLRRIISLLYYSAENLNKTLSQGMQLSLKRGSDSGFTACKDDARAALDEGDYNRAFAKSQEQDGIMYYRY